jgi:hypothetical protein
MKENISWFDAISVVNRMSPEQYQHYLKLNEWVQLYKRPKRTFLSDILTFLDNRMHQSRISTNSEFFHSVNILDKYIVPQKSPVALDWDDITYDRYTQMLDRLQTHNGLLVEWSGGLDSTFIVAILIKYGNKDVWNNTKICYNEYSVDENPYFARDIIVKYFPNRCDSTDHALKRMLEPHDGMLKIGGAGGDRIQASKFGMRWLLMYGTNDIAFVNNKDKILEFVSIIHDDTNSRAGELIYNAVVATAQQYNLDIATVGDFFWWWDFNFGMADMYGSLRYSMPPHANIAESSTSSLDWFITKEYQQWALQEYQSSTFADYNTGRSHIQHKRVIYEVDGNEFYFNFKNKVKSQSQSTAIKQIQHINNTIIPLWIDSNYMVHTCELSEIIEKTVELGLLKE